MSYYTGAFISKVLSPLRITTWVAGGATCLRPYFFYRQENDDDEWYFTPADTSDGGTLSGSSCYKLSTGMETIQFPRGERIVHQPTEIEVHKSRLRMRVAISPTNQERIPISVISFGHAGAADDLVRNEVYDSHLTVTVRGAGEAYQVIKFPPATRLFEALLDLLSISYIVTLVVSATSVSPKSIAFFAATLEAVFELGLRFFAAAVQQGCPNRTRSFLMPYASLAWGTATPKFSPRCARAPFMIEAWGGFLIWLLTVADVADGKDKAGLVLVGASGAIFLLAGWNSQVMKDLFGCRLDDQGSVFIAYAGMYVAGVAGQVRFLAKAHKSSPLVIAITSSLSILDTLIAGVSAAAAAWSFLDGNSRVLDEKVLFAKRTGVYAMLPLYVWETTRSVLVLEGRK